MYRALKLIDKGKPPGHDDLSIDKNIFRTLALMYLESWLCCISLACPHIFTVRFIEEEFCYEQNTRQPPISLMTILAKVFDSLINSQLTELLANPPSRDCRPLLYDIPIG